MLSLSPGMAMEQKWIDDLNRRFPNIGTELQEAVQQKVTKYGGELTVEELIDKLVSSPDYTGNTITDAKTFAIHSELVLLYPVVGKYGEALNESKLLRDFVLQYPPEDPKVLLTFRGVYTELLIINEQYGEALQECDETLAFDDDEEGIYLSRGVIYVKLGQLDKAFADLKTLIQKPDPKNYAQQLFAFIMDNRQAFREPQVQENTLIDVMLKDFEPQHSSKIKIPADLKAGTKPIDSPQMTALQTPSESPREKIEHSPATSQESITLPQEDLSNQVASSNPGIVYLEYEKIEHVLGTPISETEGETTIEMEYEYNGNILTIGIDKTSHNIISFQMFFLPPVDEADAFAHIGLIWRNIPPTVASNVLKVWSPYDKFSKVRLSINETKVVAIVVEP